MIDEMQAQLAGLKFFSVRNKENSYVIPSTKNFLNSIQLRALKVDQGATVSLFPIVDSTILPKIFAEFPPERFMYSIDTMRTFGSQQVVAMMIKPMASNKGFKFDLFLGCDIFPTDAVVNLDVQFAATAAAEAPSTELLSNPITAASMPHFKPIARMEFVHFYLCLEDIIAIRDNLVFLKAFRNRDSRNMLSTFNQPLTRRTNGLIGNDVLGTGASVKYDRVELFFDCTKHLLQSNTWDNIGEIAYAISAKKYLKDNIDVDELNIVGPTDIIFEASEEFNVEEDEKSV